MDFRRTATFTRIDEILSDHAAVVASLTDSIPQIEEVSERMVLSLQSGGKIVWMGNGGSAADGQHLAAELVGRFERERGGLASIALTVDSSVMTAIANDFGYDVVFERQVEALCSSRDVVVAMSTSGNSTNILNGVRSAQRLGAFTVGLCGGDGGQLAQEADFSLVVASSVTARIQEAHILIGHILCACIDACWGRLSGRTRR